MVGVGVEPLPREEQRLQAREVVARAQAYYEFLDPTVDVKAAPPTSA